MGLVGDVEGIGDMYFDVGGVANGYFDGGMCDIGEGRVQLV